LLKSGSSIIATGGDPEHISKNIIFTLVLRRAVIFSFFWGRTVLVVSIDRSQKPCTLLFGMLVSLWYTHPSAQYVNAMEDMFA